MNGRDRERGRAEGEMMQARVKGESGAGPRPPTNREPPIFIFLYLLRKN